MTILITGGTGKTGSPLARLLHSAEIPFLIASRNAAKSGQSNAVTLDWLNPDTFANPFNADPNIDRVYLVAPFVMNPFKHIFKPFIDFAVEKGVKRFVLLTSVHCEPGSPGLAEVHQYLIDIGVDYAVLRPSWFTENLSSPLYSSIKSHNEIRAAAGDGRIPWTSSEDIAQAAFDALTSEKSPNRDYYILGPELYTYDELAQVLTSELGRQIVYKRITVKEQEDLYVEHGVPRDYSHMLAVLTGIAGDGKEEAFCHKPAECKLIGKRTVKEYIRQNRSVWL